VRSSNLDDDDAILSREVTEALNASMPAVVASAARAQLASTMLLTGSTCGVVLGLLAAIFGSTVSSGLAVLAGILVAFALLIATMLVALVIGLRAKRARAQIAAVVERDHHGRLVRVQGRQVYVR